MNSRKRAINLDITPKCSLACPACFRQSEAFPKLQSKLTPMTIDQFGKIISFFDQIEFCGNLGDPTLHPDLPIFLEMSGTLKEVRVATAASYRSLAWYESAFRANPKAIWIFGLDGMPELSHRYRVHQDGEKIFQIMQLGRKLGIEVIWQFIVFNFNQHEIELARKTAERLEIRIEIMKSKRHGPGLAPGEEFIVQDSPISSVTQLVPRCYSGKKYGHSAMGYILPCCWFGDVDVEVAYPELCNSQTHLDCIDKIEEIILSKSWIEYEERLRTSDRSCYSVCWTKCGAGKSPSRDLIS
jgi:hypothetical protein